jgi:hypothetical protein
MEINNRGQTLLEIAVMMGVILIVVGGLTITVINGLKNSQFSQNQIQATKLAQEGLEKVKLISENNWQVCNNTPVALQYWDDIWNNDHLFGTRTPVSDGYNVACTDPNSKCAFKLNPPSYGASVACNSIVAGANPPAAGSIWMTSTLPTSPEIIANTPFTRLIYIEDYYDSANHQEYTQKKVTSEVTWQDSSGAHASSLVTIITER